MPIKPYTAHLTCLRSRREYLRVREQQSGAGQQREEGGPRQGDRVQANGLQGEQRLLPEHSHRLFRERGAEFERRHAGGEQTHGAAAGVLRPLLLYRGTDVCTLNYHCQMVNKICVDEINRFFINGI